MGELTVLLIAIAVSLMVVLRLLLGILVIMWVKLAEYILLLVAVGLITWVIVFLINRWRRD